MRFLSLGCSMLLITMCIIIQQQSVEAKPFIFKFFVPQAPARTDSSATSSSSSSTISTGIDFTSILTTKLNLLTSLLRTGLSNGVSGGFNFGFNKLFSNTPTSSTRRPYTSTTAKIPDAKFEPESTTKSSIKSATSTTTTTITTTTESYIYDKSTGSDDLSEPIYKGKKTETESNNNSDKDVTTDKNGYDYTTSKVTADSGYEYTTRQVIVNGNESNSGNNNDKSNNNGYEYTTSTVTSGYGYSASKPGYSYEPSNQAMSENEISNEIMMTNNQYLPIF